MKATVGGNIFNERVIQMRAICCLMPSWRSLKFVSVSFNLARTYFTLIGGVFGTRSTKNAWNSFDLPGPGFPTVLLFFPKKRQLMRGDNLGTDAEAAKRTKRGKRISPSGDFISSESDVSRRRMLFIEEKAKIESQRVERSGRSGGQRVVL